MARRMGLIGGVALPARILNAVLHLVRHPTMQQLEAGLKELDRAVLRIDWQPRCYGDAGLCLKQIFRTIINA